MKKNWTKKELLELHNMPLLELILKAAEVHKQNHKTGEVQVSSLLSIKTGGCPEDCSYCPQAARYHTDIRVQKIMKVDEVVETAKKARSAGASRMCLGAAWREVRDNTDFERVLEMVKGINALDMEVCCTLGMLTEEQAQRLAEAGLYAYNHNLDTSGEYYNEIISTRTYEERLDTIKNVRKAGVTVCSGGILGMGESVEDRLGMLLTLASLNPRPESVPINALVPVDGTPLEDRPRLPVWEMIRMIAVTRIVIPETVVRLSAGRTEMSLEAQALCFLAGANSIFAGSKLLTTPNPEFSQDMEMFRILGLTTKEPFNAKGCNHSHDEEVIEKTVVKS